MLGKCGKKTNLFRSTRWSRKITNEEKKYILPNLNQNRLSPTHGGNQNAISGWEHLWQQYKERKILGNDSLLTEAIYQLQKWRLLIILHIYLTKIPVAMFSFQVT